MAGSCRVEETHERNVRCLDDRQQHAFDSTRAAARNFDACDKNAYERRTYERQRYGHLATEGVILPFVMSVSRAQSWPLLNTAARGSYNAASVDDSFLKEKSHPTEINDNGDKSNIAADQLDDSHRVQARRLLCRHYYPEGGWGWVVTFVGTLVHLLASGLQFSIPATVALPAKVKFYHHPWHTAGEFDISERLTHKKM